jgi:5,10-methylenetetrahydrofolate reductase
MAPTWHVVTRGSERSDIEAAFERAAAAGIRQILAIRGDHAADDRAGTPTIRDVIAMAAERMPGATIGATLNQYAPDREAVLRNLRPKLKAGATYVQTQPVFDPETLRPAAEAVIEAAPGTRVIAMVMPLGANEVGRIQERLGVRLPEPFVRRLEQGGEAAAREAFQEAVAALHEAPWAHGLAVMTFAMDPAPEAGEFLCAALRAAGCD